MNWNPGGSGRLPMVLQTGAAECGLACLAMVGEYHGYHADMVALRRRFGISLRGATLKDLIQASNQIGLATRPLRLSLGEMSHLRTPCVLHWDLNHFVVLKSLGARGIVIHDPAVGVRKMTLQEVSRHFTGVALELRPAADFRPEPPAPRVRLRALVGQVVGLRRSLGQVFLIALAIEVCAVVAPFYMQTVVDQALVTADRDLLLVLSLGFFVLLLIRVSLSAMRGWMLMALGASMKVQGRANLFSHLVNLPASFFEARYMGDVMSRFGSQETILQAITTDVVEVVLDGLLAVITLGAMVLYAPALAAVVVSVAALYGLLRWFSYQPLRQASSEAIVWAARRDSHFLETLRGIKTIKLFNAQGSRRAIWVNLLVETVNRQITTQKLSLLFKNANTFLTGSLAIVVVWLGAERVLENTFSVGSLLAFVSYKDQFLSRVGALIDRGLELRMLRLHSERLADIALTAPEPSDQRLTSPEKGPPPVIEVRNLRFRYGQNEPWVLDGVSFRINPGETVAIVGPSGCGKTTLLKLLASLVVPTEGEILVDGRTQAQVGTERYRAMLGVVMQDDQLFAGSLADNISFFSESPDPDLIEECAKLASIQDEILAMPMAYDTLIGDMGTVLSGGQKQRVLLARALYHRPAILLLDEATSHLDMDRERAVNAAIRATTITRVIVAHRPETIHSTDRVIVLDKGKVVKDLRLIDRDGTPALSGARSSTKEIREKH